LKGRPKIPEPWDVRSENKRQSQVNASLYQDWEEADFFVYCVVYPESRYLYESEMFFPGAKLASPIEIEVKSSGGKYAKLKGSALLVVQKDHLNREEFERELKIADSADGAGFFVLRFQNRQGTFLETAESGQLGFAFKGGPLEADWSPNRKRENVQLYQQILSLKYLH
jgi:hypothetical protein